MFSKSPLLQSDISRFFNYVFSDFLELLQLIYNIDINFCENFLLLLRTKCQCTVMGQKIQTLVTEENRKNFIQMLLVSTGHRYSLSNNKKHEFKKWY